MTRFHSDEYINFLRIVTPDNQREHDTALSRFNILEDCPVFDGLWEYCQIAAGGSLAGATRLNDGESQTVINWAGGLHHAKRSEASGFCYINDCVLAILELLKVHARVLYVDIDIHHGDGVEEAFYTTDRVMTVSFHKYGDYFPGTGDVTDVGMGRGKNYCVNFPLKDGIDDESYREIFIPVMRKVMEFYSPGAVVLQCGADSLSGDRLGCFNLSLKGHAQCVDFFDSYDVPLLLLGGGGYTIRNVARCWAYETSRVINADITDELPYNDNYEFYGPEFRLHIATNNMENLNTREYLDKTKEKILEQLRNLQHVPSAPIMDVPRTAPLGLHNRDYNSDNDDPDVRKKNSKPKYIQEYDDSDEDDDQYLTSLPVARRKVRKSSFPRRNVSKPAQRTTSTSSPSNFLTTGNESYRAIPGSSTIVNGGLNRVHHPSLLVNTSEMGDTAGMSDERVQTARHHAPDDIVDSSRAGKRKEEEKSASISSSAKRSRPSEPAVNTTTKPGSIERDEMVEEPVDRMDISEPVSKSGPHVDGEVASPVHSGSLRGASLSPSRKVPETECAGTQESVEKKSAPAKTRDVEHAAEPNVAKRLRPNESAGQWNEHKEQRKQKDTDSTNGKSRQEGDGKEADMTMTGEMESPTLSGSLRGSSLSPSKKAPERSGSAENVGKGEISKKLK